MKKLLCLVTFSLLVTPALAEDLPPGLESARLMPGWQTQSGSRMMALELILRPGWKTYWRVPGDTGIPPQFDWSGSTNLDKVEFHWPAPEIIDSSGEITLGFHDRMILPFEVWPTDETMPVDIATHVMLGVCESICVPVDLDLTAPDIGIEPDPLIEQALNSRPIEAQEMLACQIEEMTDGMRVTLQLSETLAPQAVALELADQPEVWVSSPDLSHPGKVSAEFVAPSREPFVLDADQLIMTEVTAEGATERRGCRPVN